MVLLPFLTETIAKTQGSCFAVFQAVLRVSRLLEASRAQRYCSLSSVHGVTHFHFFRSAADCNSFPLQATGTPEILSESPAVTVAGPGQTHQCGHGATVSVANTCGNMGGFLQTLGDYRDENALVFHRKALEIFERAPGPVGSQASQSSKSRASG